MKSGVEERITEANAEVTGPAKNQKILQNMKLLISCFYEKQWIINRVLHGSQDAILQVKNA